MFCGRCKVMSAGFLGTEYCRLCYTLVVVPKKKARERLSGEPAARIFARLRWLKWSKGVRLEEVCDVLDVSPMTASAIFRRRAPKLPKAEYLVGLCEMFGVTPDQLLGYRHLDIPSDVYLDDAQRQEDAEDRID